MKNNILDNYINELVDAEIEWEDFKKYIELFSKFLGYTNLDYKYNGTYLCEFVEEFKCIHSAIKIKNARYSDIFIWLGKINENFSVVLDNICQYDFYKENGNQIKRYIGINIDKILSKNIEVNVHFSYEEKEYLFYKEYDASIETISMLVLNDIEEFIQKVKEEGMKI